MTNPIPPCPVCGTVPPKSQVVDVAVCPCKCLTLVHDYSEYAWDMAVQRCLYRALRTHGIHTLAQLTERLDLLTQYRVNNDAQIRRIAELESVSPDPRVAVLEQKIKELTQIAFRIYFMHDNHTFTCLEWASVDDIISKANRLFSADRYGSMCPIIVCDRNGKEIRRVGIFAHSPDKIPEWVESIKADSEVWSLIAAQRGEG